MTILSFPNRIFLVRLAAVATVLVFALFAAQAEANKPPRVGGKVNVAWPKGDKGKPKQALAQYLAEQVGALKPPSGADTRSATRVPLQSSTGGDGSATLQGGGGVLSSPLRLVRSFDIPRADPSYDRLLNVSFTYDSAIGAAAFSATGNRTQAEQLLDQLAALQRTDGSIDYAYDTLTGGSDAHFWAGTIAWTGYAAELYRTAYKSTRYSKVSAGVSTWLTSMQLPNGLIKGGPTVTWASTLHNLVAWNFFTTYAKNNSGQTKTKAQAMANKIAAGIDANLIINDSSGMRFKQGLDDTTLALDAQTMGIMYLISRGKTSDAGKVADYMQSNFAVSNKTITKSSDPLTFNETYESTGPFSGYRPYAGVDDAPDVLWMEGTLQARLAQVLLGRSTTTLDQSITRWRAVAGSTTGPLMANATSTTRFNEYHVWPVSATASWILMNGLK